MHTISCSSEIVSTLTGLLVTMETVDGRDGARSSSGQRLVIVITVTLTDRARHMRVIHLMTIVVLPIVSHQLIILLLLLLLLML